jgi:CCR4-NOT transcription complex subunit 1
MSQPQNPWGAPRHSQNPSARLPPISTTAHARDTPSPTANFPSLPPPNPRLVGSRKSSLASSASSPFSPAGQQPGAQLLSARSRPAAPHAVSQLASSAAAQTGAGTSKLARASPAPSTSSTAASPSPASGAASQNLSRIVIAQIFLLLSQFGPLKDDKDRAKWDTQIEQIRKVCLSPALLPGAY